MMALLDTGTPLILLALAENGQQAVAQRMFQEKECPSLLYCASMGATTIWERRVRLQTLVGTSLGLTSYHLYLRWDSMLPDGTINPGEMTSFNHYALGSVVRYLHEYIGGIRPLSPGYKRFSISPRPAGTLKSSKVWHVSPYGMISCEWTLKGQDLHVEIQVPPNSTAEVVLPGVKITAGSGKRSLDVKWEGDKAWPPKAIEKRHASTKDVDMVVE